MIFVDANVPMYVVGADHPHKRDSQRMLEDAVAARQRLVTDAEVLQEICHRYVAINRREAIQPTFETLLGAVDEVLPVERADVERAGELLLAYGRLSARDAIHAAIIQRHEIERVMSFDQGFDDIPGVERLA